MAAQNNIYSVQLDPAFKPASPLAIVLAASEQAALKAANDMVTPGLAPSEEVVGRFAAEDKVQTVVDELQGAYPMGQEPNDLTNQPLILAAF